MSQYEDDNYGKDAWRLEDPAQLAPLPERRELRPRHSMQPAQPHGVQPYQGGHTAPPHYGHPVQPAQGYGLPGVPYGHGGYLAPGYSGHVPGIPPSQPPGAQPFEGHRAWQGPVYQEPTFFELAEWYQHRARTTGIARRTMLSEDGYIRAALEWLRSRGIDRPTTADWKEYLDYRMSPECSMLDGQAGRVTPRTAESHRHVLGKVYRRCRDIPSPAWWHVPNPLDTHVLPRCYAGGRDVPRSLREPFITYPRLQMAMPDVVAKAFISVMRWHGLRVQEALAIPLPGSQADASMGGRVLDLLTGSLRIERQRTRDNPRHERLKTEFSRANLKLAPEPARLLHAALMERQKELADPGTHWRRRTGECARNYLFPYYRVDLARLMEIHRISSPIPVEGRRSSRAAGQGRASVSRSLEEE
ncbi:hypothetical protein [Hyalangium minutum]|uniref:Uncharacterized protein n=1 Tax=Hyalangium minutum TaxID=394096 RepID=A0A085VXD4_9BACT|nr:hypothetical protein [Hyalangium minutum]KFE60097.1 hypothetical protein DB31_5968 [Hyalangium minutum]